MINLETEVIYRVRGYSPTFSTEREAKLSVLSMMINEERIQLMSARANYNVFKDKQIRLMRFKREIKHITFAEIQESWRLQPYGDFCLLRAKGFDIDLKVPQHSSLKSGGDVELLRLNVMAICRFQLNELQRRTRQYKRDIKKSSIKLSELCKLKLTLN